MKTADYLKGALGVSYLSPHPTYHCPNSLETRASAIGNSSPWEPGNSSDIIVHEDIPDTVHPQLLKFFLFLKLFYK